MALKILKLGGFPSGDLSQNLIDALK